MSERPAWLEGAEVVTSGDRRPAGEVKASPSNAAFYWDKFKTGVAGGAGALVDAPERALNLLGAGVGTVAGLAGHPEFMPPTSNYNRGTDFFRELLGVQGLGPMQRGQAITGAVAEGAGAGAAGGLPLAARISMARMAAQGALAGGSAELADQMSGGNPLAEVAGGLAGGVAVPSSFLRQGGTLVGGARALGNVAGDMSSDPRMSALVERIVQKQLQDAVAGTPNAAANIEEALRLRGKIPGFNPSVAEMAGSEGAAQMQRRYALTSPENMNSELARVEANKQALRNYFESVAPEGGNPSRVRSVLNQNLSDAQQAVLSKEQSVANQLPKANQLDIGERLSTAAQAEKSAATPAIRAAYEDAFAKSGNSKVDIAPVIAKVEEILGTKLAQIKPESAPQTVRKLNELANKGGPSAEDAAYISSRLGGTIESAPSKASSITLKDADEIRKAVNADIASAGQSMNPMAATQLRNLGQVHKVLDEAIGNSSIPEAAKTAYADALNKYRTEYAPRFKEGANLRVFKDNSANEPRILPDKFVSEYFRPDSQAGGTRAEQFGRLFGNNQGAKDAAQTGILDLYRQKVVDPTTGVINQQAHNAFMRDYGRTLDSFAAKGVGAADEIKRIGSEAVKANFAGQKIRDMAKDLKFDTVDDLVAGALSSPRTMANISSRLDERAKQTFTRLLMDKAMESGTAGGITKFLQENEKTLRMAPGMTDRNFTNLKEIAKAYEIAERAPIKGNVETGGPDVLKNATGVSTATVYAQLRAVTGNRQAPVTMAVNLALPAISKLGQTRFSDVMENALQNPRTAENLRNFLLANNPQQANGFAQRILDGLKEGAGIVWTAKGPILKHVIGTDKYPTNAAISGIPTGVVAGDQNK